jgi:hypothetical protein
MTGWVPPQLLLLLAVRGAELMHDMDAASLAQVKRGLWFVLGAGFWRHLAQMAGSCVMAHGFVMAGWAPPQLLLLLAVRGAELMHDMDAASLAQVRVLFGMVFWCRAEPVVLSAAALT